MQIGDRVMFRANKYSDWQEGVYIGCPDKPMHPIEVLFNACGWSGTHLVQGDNGAIHEIHAKNIEELQQ
jgi:hypothetical protein